ncbi:amino acid/amide ABC transporter membrane protein 1, HAAT family [Palleronia marisminoris]|uniref:High-affinity branched-chain amino acid transport system permease protein LivH n=1 Tax=Palleronia marisminoris TaxID=315423 RepID=A0A1Y5TVA5_9RHOB|nr:urea ABC transporter permease subunit UrtB [Palleronia marisminoris]SFH51853.1 amino acid/amide ABC transporter membrane protein 1, HAAT family [Palleronia marisminoris]SLN71044.1 High-affinity branched-chain amino acid transport system permease protein LivH [Palleronia marisminoris]
MLRILILALGVLTLLPTPGRAQDLQTILQLHTEEVENPGRQTVGVVIEDLIAAEMPVVPVFLTHWQDREIVLNAEDGRFYALVDDADGQATIRDLDTGAESTVAAPALTEVRPNGGVRREIAAALVRFQLSDPAPANRRAALDAIARQPDADQIAPLAASVEDEEDEVIRADKERLLNILTARYGDTTEARITAIERLSGRITPDARAALSQVLTTSDQIGTGEPDGNVAQVYTPGDEITRAEAYGRLVDEGLAPAPVSPAAIRDALIANIEDGAIAGVPVAEMNTDAARRDAYERLAEAGTVPPFVPDEQIDAALESHVFYAVYDEDDPLVTDAARATLRSVDTQVSLNKTADLALDALSLASIYFLAAIGLAITFGVMGVINMAHGEFIMMGAYTGYVVQQIVPDYTLSLIIALPLAFVVAGAAGIAMERLVIRHLYHRPLETLLATFGISIALQQLAKNIFGTQARPLTAPDWLSGQLVFNELVAISYIRIAIFVLAGLFLALLLFILRRTRLGLEVRAVTQNRGMAASMGIDPDKINMATFGLGSGIAGIAGVAIGLYAQVTSEMGANYIVQSFMTVVVGGVGNVWGTLAGAGLIGVLQKSIESMNPSNTLAAQTYMILFIIIFIQFRPRGIVALRGRAAEA